ncbi:hypothetical protein CASFOL_003055 [Castilleja foliolosa]|uniref:Uncharacterized protein n=1 Tax=Castilleja foliolosa TaxID=1961234 RepID=A0ABD3EJX9_9LAMI
MDKTEPVPCVDFVAILVVEESGDVFEGLCYSAPNSTRSLLALPRAAAAAAAVFAATI